MAGERDTLGVSYIPITQRPSGMPFHKYRGYRRFTLPDRTWPDKVAQRAPLWCSVDLRDGNQALIDPMDLDRRRKMYNLLVRLGFKEIELGFPLASQVDWDFTREVIERDAIPDDVTIQVMSPIRDGMIEETVKSIVGAPRAILQVYNPTSATQRRVVFNMDRAEVKKLALWGAETALKVRDSLPGTEIYLQYGTESFTQTEPSSHLRSATPCLTCGARSPPSKSASCSPRRSSATRPKNSLIEWSGCTEISPIVSPLFSRCMCTTTGAPGSQRRSWDCWRRSR